MGDARFSVSAGAAHPMDVILAGHGEIVVDDALDITDVDPAPGEIGRDENGMRAAAEIIQRFLPLRLRPSAVQEHRRQPIALDHLEHFVGAPLSPREDEDLSRARLDVLQQQGIFIDVGRGVIFLHDFRRGLRRLADADPHRLVEIFGHEGKRLFRQRRREEKRLPLLRKERDDLHELRRESHVEHAVDFVEHQHANFREP